MRGKPRFAAWVMTFLFLMPFSRKRAANGCRRRCLTMSPRSSLCQLGVHLRRLVRSGVVEHCRSRCLLHALAGRLSRYAVIASALQAAFHADQRVLAQPGAFTRMGLSRSPISVDVVFELFDNELLITDDALHQIAN